jgi:hypothetical protein
MVAREGLAPAFETDQNFLEKHMKIKTSELTGAALDWAVAKCEGANWEDGLLVWYDDESVKRQCRPNAYSTDWLQGGPIIEREGIGLGFGVGVNSDRWEAGFSTPEETGPTPLIAAMRCYVASKLGDDVDVPDEIC